LPARFTTSRFALSRSVFSDIIKQMVDSAGKQPSPDPSADAKVAASGYATPAQENGVRWRYGGYLLSFFAGILIAVVIRYLFKGTNVQLTPEMFVSLAFTVAVGAASLVLAIVAINYGRISERIMTERADHSIDIQMNLFQKSLSLQTQLFDRTMSTLESIGRSTGVTEQRLIDIHSYMQSPGFLKQVAGRAVEQTTTELSTSGKSDVKSQEFDSRLAERLTKNIVEQLSAKWDSLNRPAVASPGLTVGETNLASLANPSPPILRERSFEEQLRRQRSRLRIERQRQVLQAQLGRAVGSIAGATLTQNDLETGGYWENTISYKDKTIAIDFRYSSVEDLSNLDRSIQDLFQHLEVNGLLFMFRKAPSDAVRKHIEKRNKELEEINGAVSFVVAGQEPQLHDDLLAALEKATAELPSAE
jgi:hypothetical protein